MIIDSALYLAGLGFHVFPGEIVITKSGKLVKKPMFSGWQESATCDLEAIEGIWKRVPDAMPCISTSWFTNGSLWHLLAIDVDNKDGQNGSRSAAELGGLLPVTFAQRTPTGGFHFIYKTKTPTPNTSKKIGAGLDTRGWHGLVVGAGSVTPVGTYTIAILEPVAEAPAGLIELVGTADTRGPNSGERPPGIDATAATQRGIQYLSSLPVAQNGTIDDSAFAAACALRQHGLSQDDIYECMGAHFKSELPVGRLADIAKHAYRYAKDPAGSLAPEILFKDAIQNPPEAGDGEHAEPPPASGTAPDWFNEDHAVCQIGSGCNVLKTGKDSYGKPKLTIMGTEAFHIYYAGLTTPDEKGKAVSMSRTWMNSRNRATFEGLEFAPGRPLPPTYYNLWRGFAFEPQQVGSERAHRALENTKHHILHNMARDDKKLAHHITSYVAQIFQKPQEKHPTSMVIRGEKGSGKDTALNIFGELLGIHYMSTAQPADVTGQFNAAMEAKLLVVYNEAVWAYDHKAESILKDIVTSRRIRIERKFCDPYFVDNLARIVIMGNANTLVPASTDERRWFVIDMRDIPPEEAQAHIDFCTELREGMEAGGYPLLLDYLLNYDISGVDLRVAPNSQGLVEQKEANLPAIHQWFRESLGTGNIVGLGVPMGWPDRVEKGLLRQAFRRWKKENEVGGREPSDNMFGRVLRDLKMGILGDQKTKDGKNAYTLPTLEDARKMWDKFIKAVKPTVW